MSLLEGDFCMCKIHTVLTDGNNTAVTFGHSTITKIIINKLVTCNILYYAVAGPDTVVVSTVQL